MDDFKTIFYVYTHTRLDTGDVFYVGILRIHSEDRAYTRAYEFKGANKRNKIWKSIYRECHNNIRVDIVFKSSDIGDVFNKEIELIKFYGKIIDKRGGTLANISNGGEKTASPAKPVYQYDKKGCFIKMWDNVNEASSELGIKISAINQAIRERGLCNQEFLFSRDYEDRLDEYRDKRKKRIDCYTVLDNTFHKTFNSIKDASRSLGIDSSSIVNCINKKRKSAGGYYWANHGEAFNPPRPKIVINQYTMENKFIKTYYSYAEIKKDLNINSSNAIKNCFVGKQKQAYGYVWKLYTPREAKELGFNCLLYSTYK